MAHWLHKSLSLSPSNRITAFIQNGRRNRYMEWACISKCRISIKRTAPIRSPTLIIPPGSAAVAGEESASHYPDCTGYIAEELSRRCAAVTDPLGRRAVGGRR